MVGSHTVCVPIVGPGVTRALTQLTRAAAAGVDAVEVRLDLIGRNGQTVLARACAPAGAGSQPKPAVIATCRGGDAGTHQAMAAAGPSYVDVDLADAPNVLPALRQTLDAGQQLIISHHDWAGTPTAAALAAVRQRCINLGADIVKIVTSAHSTADAFIPAQLLVQTQSAVPTVAFAMGPHGQASRVLAPLLGSPISYVALDADTESAPGQLPVSHTPMLRALAARRHVAAVQHRQPPGSATHPESSVLSLYAVVGNPVSHSLSPIMHNAAYAADNQPAVYVPILATDIWELLTQVTRGELDTVAPLRGLSVTIPHKESAYTWLTSHAAAEPGSVDIDSAATAIGAVNTISFDREGDAPLRITATNTDWIGVVRTAERLIAGHQSTHRLTSQPTDQPTHQHPLVGMTAMVIGAGGTARAAAYGLMRSGATVTVVNRTHSRAVELADALGCQAAQLEEALGAAPDSTIHPPAQRPIADILVNASSVGLGELSDQMPLPESAITRFRFVVDAVYAPSGTPLVRAARQAGVPVAGGESILLHQGVAQYERWFSRPAPESAMAQALESAMSPAPVTFTVPGSKSITQRALICAALAEGTSTIAGALISEDTQLLLGALRQLGAGVQQDGTTLTITGVGGAFSPSSDTIYLGNNGTAMRLLTALVCLGSGTYRLDGTARLRERPVGTLVDALRSLGAQIQYEDVSGYLPITVAGGTLSGGQTAFGKLDSSQYISALMMVAPYTRQGIRITLDAPLVSAPYVEITRRVLDDFGVSVSVSHAEISVAPGTYQARAYAVEADASSASYPAAAAAVLRRSVHISGVTRASMQGDAGFLSLVEQLGASLDWSDGGVTVRGRGLVPGDRTFDMSDMPDVVPTLAVLAAFRNGVSDIVNVAHLRVKESDRIAATVAELRRIGCDAEELPDGIRVHGRGGAGLHGAEVHTYDDHRIAMSFAVAALQVPGIRIENPACVAKSFASFWDEVAALGFRQAGNRVPEQIVLIGYRATGKTTIGRALARELAVPFVDTDQVLVATHGRTISAIVEAGGWDAFRTLESETVAELATRTGPVVLAVGGGTLTDGRSRRALQQMRDRGATFVWLQAPPETIARWITQDASSAAGRPGLLGSSSAASSYEEALDEVRQVLSDRIPQYAAFADLAVSTDGWDANRTVREILEALGEGALSGPEQAKGAEAGGALHAGTPSGLED